MALTCFDQELIVCSSTQVNRMAQPKAQFHNRQAVINCSHIFSTYFQSQTVNVRKLMFKFEWKSAADEIRTSYAFWNFS